MTVDSVTYTYINCIYEARPLRIINLAKFQSWIQIISTVFFQMVTLFLVTACK